MSPDQNFKNLILDYLRQALCFFAEAENARGVFAHDMVEWNNVGDFSVDASVRIEAADRARLERLMQYRLCTY